jgi:hypothetical protein
MPIIPTFPLHHLASVGKLLGGIFVLHQPFAIAVPAHINAKAGISALGEPRMRQGITRTGAIAFAIGKIFENHRNGIRGGIFGHPDPRRKAAAVG